MRHAQHPLATGSCFFWRFEARTFLVTNWHNLSGRNPLTGELMSSSGATPDRVLFTVFRRVSEPDSEGFFELQVALAEVALLDAEHAPV